MDLAILPSFIYSAMSSALQQREIVSSYFPRFRRCGGRGAIKTVVLVSLEIFPMWPLGAATISSRNVGPFPGSNLLSSGYP